MQYSEGARTDTAVQSPDNAFLWHTCLGNVVGVGFEHSVDILRGVGRAALRAPAAIPEIAQEPAGGVGRSYALTMAAVATEGEHRSVDS